MWLFFAILNKIIFEAFSILFKYAKISGIDL
jgi:hypothetical protein